AGGDVATSCSWCREAGDAAKRVALHVFCAVHNPHAVCDQNGQEERAESTPNSATQVYLIDKYRTFLSRRFGTQLEKKSLTPAQVASARALCGRAAAAAATGTSMTKPTEFKPRLSRRDLLKRTAATVSALALTESIRLAFPGGVHVAQAAGPEVKKALLGFIALTDAAPLFVAKEKGLFAKYGMPDVEVQKQASWGATRDNLVLGSEGNGIDGAHILTPMAYLISAGKVTQNNQPTPMYIMARLNLDAQCISVAKEYADLKLSTDASPFKVALEKKKASGKAVKAAMTFPGGTHDLWIRYWLAAGGIDPDKDIETIVVPP